MIYAFFDYDLFVVGEVQAFGAIELALKIRLNGRSGSSRGTLRNLVDRARKAGILPPVVSGNSLLDDPIEAFIELRNDLAHGSTDIHSPGMAIGMLATCAEWINEIFP